MNKKPLKRVAHRWGGKKAVDSSESTRENLSKCQSLHLTSRVAYSFAFDLFISQERLTAPHSSIVLALAYRNEDKLPVSDFEFANIAGRSARDFTFSSYSSNLSSCGIIPLWLSSPPKKVKFTQCQCRNYSLSMVTSSMQMNPNWGMPRQSFGCRQTHQSQRALVFLVFPDGPSATLWLVKQQKK